MGISTGRLLDLVAGCLGDKIMGRSGDIRGTAVMYIFKIQFRNIVNLL